MQHTAMGASRPKALASSSAHSQPISAEGKESSVMSAAYLPVFCILVLGIAKRGLLWSTPTIRTHRVALTR
jgi:hypothetical protein